MDNKADLLSISVTRGTRIFDALETLNRSGVGLLLLVDAAGALERTVTDGDIRRLLLGGASTDDTLARLAPQLPLWPQLGLLSAPPPPQGEGARPRAAKGGRPRQRPRWRGRRWFPPASFASS